MQLNRDRTGGAGVLARAGGAAACALCCGIPMLVLVGAVSAGAILAGGIVVGSVLVVLAIAASVMAGRRPQVSDRWQLALLAAGGSACFAGIWGAASQRPGAHLIISGGIGALAVAALLSLAGVESRRCQSPAPSDDSLSASAHQHPKDGTR